MQMQRVYRVTSGQGFERLQEFNEPVPVAAAHEVLIRIRSISLNYRDIAILTEKYPHPVRDHVVPCSDMAGEVVQIGERVDNIAVGDFVTSPGSITLQYGSVTARDAMSSLGGSTDGVLREYMVLPAHIVVKLPRSSHSLNDWASFMTTGSTVWNAFYGQTTLRPGSTVLMLGTGGVSLTALILAKAAGATTLITSSSDEKLAHMRQTYGADHTINYQKFPRWAAEVQRITAGRGVDHVVEVGGAGTIEQSLEAVAWGGTVSVIGFLTSLPQEQMPNVVLLTLIKGVTLRGILGGSKQQLEEAIEYFVSDGKILLRLSST